MSYPTSPIKPIYPHTPILKQEVHPLHYPSFFCLPDPIPSSLFNIKTKSATTSCPLLSPVPSLLNSELANGVHTAKSHWSNANNMDDSASLFSSKPTSPVEMLANENILSELKN